MRIIDLANKHRDSFKNGNRELTIRQLGELSAPMAVAVTAEIMNELVGRHDGPAFCRIAASHAIESDAEKIRRIELCFHGEEQRFGMGTRELEIHEIITGVKATDEERESAETTDES